LVFSYRAAAHNKLNNNDQALSDCFRSIEIDPNYSKAYGRLGYIEKTKIWFINELIIDFHLFSVIYLSLDKAYEALDAYKKAHALEPNNENYKQSVKICEDRINGAPGGANAAGVCWSFSVNFILNLVLYLGS
jgi:small glutamine-rich tetratricopeptide repeat-containing protein alpha